MYNFDGTLLLDLRIHVFTYSKMNYKNHDYDFITNMVVVVVVVVVVDFGLYTYSMINVSALIMYMT